MNKRVISLIACLYFSISFTVMSRQTGEPKQQPKRIAIKAGVATIKFSLPRQGVSLLVLELPAAD